MSFLVQHFVPNALDVFHTGKFPLSMPLLKAEMLSDHRISSRKFVAETLPKNGVGAELGVFTGLFSASLLKYTKARKIYFVDPWWEVFGDKYPDWGVYTSNGQLTTKAAYDAAKDRIARQKGNTETAIVVDTSDHFLTTVPDRHFDWIYLDSTHDYDGTVRELALLRDKMKPGGVIFGDDWHEDEAHPHAGVSRAVKEALLDTDYELVGTYPALQWAIRTPR